MLCSAHLNTVDTVQNEFISCEWRWRTPHTKINGQIYRIQSVRGFASEFQHSRIMHAAIKNGTKRIEEVAMVIVAVFFHFSALCLKTACSSNLSLLWKCAHNRAIHQHKWPNTKRCRRIELKPLARYYSQFIKPSIPKREAIEARDEGKNSIKRGNKQQRPKPLVQKSTLPLCTRILRTTNLLSIIKASTWTVYIIGSLAISNNNT